GIWPLENSDRALIATRWRRVLAVRPRSGEALVIGRFECAAAVAAGPAINLRWLTAILAAALQARGPRSVRRRGAATFLIPEQRLPGAVALHAHRDRRKCGGAEFRRAHGFAIAS